MDVSICGSGLDPSLRMYIEKRAWSYNVIGCATTLDPL